MHFFTTWHIPNWGWIGNLRNDNRFKYLSQGQKVFISCWLFNVWQHFQTFNSYIFHLWDIVLPTKLWLQGDTKIYCCSCPLDNMSSLKLYSGPVVYILFFININELILRNAKLWSVFSSLIFAHAIINFGKFLLIAFS